VQVFHSSRVASIAEIIGFKQGQVPFVYLGVRLSQGKPHMHHLQPSYILQTRLDAKYQVGSALSC
jgi:hypothetical protein